MDQVYQHIEDIVALAEAQDGFYEVEVTVFMRRNGGAESDFIRMQLENFDGKSRKLMMKKTQANTNAWF